MTIDPKKEILNLIQKIDAEAELHGDKMIFDADRNKRLIACGEYAALHGVSNQLHILLSKLELGY